MKMVVFISIPSAVAMVTNPTPNKTTDLQASDTYSGSLQDLILQFPGDDGLDRGI